MCSLAANLETANELLLAKLAGSSLEELARSLPSAHTTDVHMLSGERLMREASEEADWAKREELHWAAFQQLSQCHATLYHHRLHQKLLRQSRNEQKHRKSGSKATNGNSEQLQQQLDVRDMLAALPTGWVVVHVSSGVADESRCSISRLLAAPPSRHTLHISRATTGPRPSLLLQSISNCEDSLLEELERIKEQNKVLNKDYADNVTKYSAMREQLDSRLKSVVRGLESSWLGVWRCLVAGSVQQEEDHLLDCVRTAAAEADMLLTDQQASKLVLAMSCPAVEISPHDVTKHKTAAARAAPPNSYLKCAVASVLCESVRSAPVQQLWAALQRQKKSFSKARGSNRGPLLLILDKSVVSLPWEAMSCLRDQPVTRMPSLLSLYTLYKKQRELPKSVVQTGIECSNGYYLLDPESNLPRTQQRLSAAFTATGWPGMLAARPSHQQFKEALTDSDIFVYVGHGSGSQYLPGDLVEDVTCRAAVLLYGCSSVRLQPRGYIADPWGVLLNYLIANCPCVVGMLWEVTDKDTDLLTANMLECLMAAKGGALQGDKDIPSLVARSRALCNRYLTASAIAVYGLPCSVRVNKCS